MSDEVFSKSGRASRETLHHDAFFLSTALFFPRHTLAPADERHPYRTVQHALYTHLSFLFFFFFFLHKFRCRTYNSVRQSTAFVSHAVTQLISAPCTASAERRGPTACPRVCGCAQTQCQVHKYRKHALHYSFRTAADKFPLILEPY